MSFPEYADYDGLSLAALVKSGQVSPLELVEAAIERIERHNGQLNAVVYKAYDEARAAAKAERTKSRRPRRARACRPSWAPPAARTSSTCGRGAVA